jgi:hypothetical protein
MAMVGLGSRARAALGLCAVLSCSSQSRHVDTPGPVTEPAPLGCRNSDEPLCTEPISRLVIDDLASRGLAPELAEPDELCRRLAIDTLGRAPTPHQMKLCRQEPYEKTVDTWLAAEEHVELRRAIWLAVTGVGTGYGWAGHTADFDELITEHARGKLPYGTFASRVVLHPAFYQRHPGDDWFRATYDVFLGRSARQDEIVGLSPLLSIWGQRSAYVARTWANEVAFDLCNCSDRGHACVSDTLGRRIDLRSRACTHQQLNTRGRFVRLVEVTIGQDKNAFAENDDRDRVGPLPAADDSERERLEQIPRALTARPDFWERAVDRELERLLGWWHTTFVVPDSDLPDVRRMLVEKLEETGSIREVERAILTSVLYRMSSLGDRTREDAVEWATGPRKLMSGQAWVGSASIALDARYDMCPRQGTEAGPYGHRTADPYNILCASPLALTASPATLDAQQELANHLCGGGDNVLPSDFDPTDPAALERAARHLVRTLLGRDATGAEMHGLAADMDACVEEGKDAVLIDEVGCESEAAAVRWTCTRILNSAEYGTY